MCSQHFVLKMNRSISQTVEKQQNALCGQTHDVGVSFLGDQRRVSFVKFAVHLKYSIGDKSTDRRGLRLQFNRTSCCKE